MSNFIVFMLPLEIPGYAVRKLQTLTPSQQVSYTYVMQSLYNSYFWAPVLYEQKLHVIQFQKFYTKIKWKVCLWNTVFKQ